MENTTPETAMVPEESPAAPETGSPAGNEKKAPKLKLPGKRKHRWIKVVIVLAVLAGAGYGAYRHFSGKSAGQVDTSYLVAQAARQDLTVSVSGTATLLPADSFNVTTLISGEIMSGEDLQEGRFLQYIDVDRYQDVCVIGSYIAQAAFRSDALGKTLSVGGAPYTVIGVLSQKADGTEGSDDDLVYLPYGNALHMNSTADANFYLMTSTSRDTASVAKGIIENRLYTTYQDKDAYFVMSVERRNLIAAYLM
jgi:hypothetical protein